MEITTDLASGLPFAPTGDQQRAIDAIFADLGRDRPMQRLLMGEVGSGKTVVALAAMLRALDHGMQAALMAPTETLAEQHFATIQALLGGESVPLALLTGSTPAAQRRDVLGKLETGQLGLLVGTHALIEESVAFDRLAVAVVDEQHRFGVRQRTALDRKAAGGHAEEILADLSPGVPVTTNFMSMTGFRHLDYHQWAPHQDIVSTDHYLVNTLGHPGPERYTPRRRSPASNPKSLPGRMIAACPTWWCLFPCLPCAGKTCRPCPGWPRGPARAIWPRWCRAFRQSPARCRPT